MASSSRATPSAPSQFTPEMQDRQARNKDPYTGRPLGGSGSGSSSSNTAADADDDNNNTGARRSPSSSPGRTTPKVLNAADDAFESRQKRRWAATILNSAELLQLHALARNDSVPGTRQHFTKILCGYEDSHRSSERRAAAAAAAKKEKDKKAVSRVVYKPVTGAFEL